MRINLVPVTLPKEELIKLIEFISYDDLIGLPIEVLDRLEFKLTVAFREKADQHS